MAEQPQGGNGMLIAAIVVLIFCLFGLGMCSGGDYEYHYDSRW